MELPLKRISLFSSGVGYFEHSGKAEKPEHVSLSFKNDAVNDALKSLAINDPASDFPAVSYSSPEAVEESLQSLKVGLSSKKKGGILDILDSLRGADIEVSLLPSDTVAPSSVSGRILAVDYEFVPVKFDGETTETKAGELRDVLLLLLTAGGIRSVPIKNITNYAYRDKKISADFNRALDLLLSARDKKSVDLSLSLPGEGSREVSLSYVIPAPVWKAAYHLDLGGEKPLLQGWAVVDNDSNSDWNDVELSLVIGRPVSFIQNLYAPYHTDRPVLPLAIANFAKARTYESGTLPFRNGAVASFSPRRSTVREDINRSFSVNENNEESSSDYLAALNDESVSKVETARARDSGDQFEFTFRRPVNLARRSSAMFPLVDSPLEAEKFLVLTDDEMTGCSLNPAISVRLTNTTGMKLPAGPITVYDGAYAGDALVGFLPENEQRLISYGEDLTVTGFIDWENETVLVSASVAEGCVTIKRREIYKRIYTVRNAADIAKKLIIQHRKRIFNDAVLVEPTEYMEETFDCYRFKTDLPAGAEISFTVTEEKPLTKMLTLVGMSEDVMLTYAANGELPAGVRESFGKAMALKKKADEEHERLEELAAEKEKLIEDQERIRKNLESAGSSSPHGQKYLKRMNTIDEKIDALDGEIAAAEKQAREAARTYGKFIGDESWKPEIRKDDGDEDDNNGD
ncbi:MAG: hypothetical protein LBG26_06055 [Treponema sp.]|jgi:hypothetical protein|nr:hypothetical protein [Treponema sp.]